MEIKTIKQKFLGFTLVELLVAMAIIGILAAITLAGFSQGNKKRSVVLATDAVLGAIRTAQNDSLNPQPIQNGTCAPNNLPVEYHLTFSAGSANYQLRAKNKCGTTTTLQDFKLPNNVKVGTSSDSLKLDSSSGGGLDIKFSPPFGAIRGSLNAVSFVSFTQAYIRLQSSDGTVTRQVILDGVSGRVDVQ